jgi:hypothetical protein
VNLDIVSPCTSLWLLNELSRNRKHSLGGQAMLVETKNSREGWKMKLRKKISQKVGAERRE